LGYDHYAAARYIADRLIIEGQYEWSEKLKNVMADGATGSEIFMGLRYHLQQLKGCGVPISEETGRHVDYLMNELDRALKQPDFQKPIFTHSDFDGLKNSSV
jgi:hypothetical protein